MVKNYKHVNLHPTRIESLINSLLVIWRNLKELIKLNIGVSRQAVNIPCLSNRRQGNVRPLAIALYVFGSNTVNTF